ncbi:hypothetical protein ACOBQB_31315 [Streptomyces sp. G5(2025)]|uniref:hypothetical protein n=1 Tax=Streptomyces sp. G5(2025) TaxID=3406628 RepID=UPI003C187016
MSDARDRTWLAAAVEEARLGLAEGGVPIGAAHLGRGHNRRGQDGDPGTDVRGLDAHTYRRRRLDTITVEAGNE